MTLTELAGAGTQGALGPWLGAAGAFMLVSEDKEVLMHAQKGDRLVIRGHNVGDLDRDGEILEVGEHGGPPYRIRWSDNGHEGLIFPGSDAAIRHPNPGPRRRPKPAA